MDISELKNYRFVCTLTYGDIYGQVMIWLIVIFLGLASSLVMMNDPTHAFLTGGLIFVISLPFLLFAFVTTLLNHIELRPIETANESQPTSSTSTSPDQSRTGAVQHS